MGTELYVNQEEAVYVNRYYGGKKKGTCIQITKVEGDTVTVIQMTLGTFKMMIAGVLPELLRG